MVTGPAHSELDTSNIKQGDELGRPKSLRIIKLHELSV